jgi:adenosylhomocysteine nucleosidase
MLLGIIGAMNIEVIELIKSMDISDTENFSEIVYHIGRINGNDVVIAKCGMGKVRATICTQTMILKYSPNIIVNTGVAGGLSPNLKTGDIIIASSVVEYDSPDRCITENPLRMASDIHDEYFCDESVVEKLSQSVEHIGINYCKGLIATGDRYICKKEDKQSIIDRYHAAACNMESGSIGQVCSCSKVPFGIIRSISDNADDCETPIDISSLKKVAESVKVFLEKVNS